ncbi:MAG: acetyl-CoA carboxylase biotin carboxyl carrier protein [Clostridiales bacterium]|jgi:acetyl-CoA carboxylase biotin carboxyl carrier protein|nr:acetyl-CoA carboxylase biotin carboxyl carrier protein [Clostridiales bacterium]
MNFHEVKELINIIGKSNLREFEFKNSAVYIRMNKNETFPAERIKKEPESNFSDIINNHGEEINTQHAVIDEASDSGLFIKSPLVGTFYESPSPENAPFVKQGDRVKKGQVLCIIEAMKVMNEILSDYDGVIIQSFVKNEEMVEFGQNLYMIKE